ncbi:Fic family protein [Flavobacterium sp. Fl-318]|uniref:Fic family protein n=1 Tax=Flavobacterium cupriresistens TaxID=2893885 RepID=A0ABU4RF62_9FLAO|nr:MULTISPECIES: Fic family protein [unclassified Flavobacterium]MDX6190453.1 Fic family protein [Flavobacterium sp. Fl-318]UFH43516.1 Fic family protein [Flavobacterium sp. F-323]
MLEHAPISKYDTSTIDLLKQLTLSGELKEINDDYLYWDKVKYKTKSIEPEQYWNAVKLSRSFNKQNILFGTYQFNFNVTDYILRLLHHFDLNIGGNLGSNVGITETDKNKFLISSIMEEAISSSQMEGANTTRKAAKEMIQKERKPKNKSEQMIMNNYATMKYIVQHKNDDLTPEKLLFIHRLIANNTLDSIEEEGKFRENNDIYVVNYSNSEIVHIPPKKEEIEVIMNDLCVFFNEEQKTFIHPIIKGIIIHFMIGWIHPFTDGNGRTARALFYWYMLKNGYWLTEYLTISTIIKDTKIQYEKAFLYSEIDQNDLTYFITYHIKTMEKAFIALKEYISRKQNEVIQAAKFVKIPNVNDRQAQILKILNEDSDRVLSSKEMENRFGISNFTARSDLNNLESLGFLEKIQVNKIKHNFIKAKQFNKILKSYKL